LVSKLVQATREWDMPMSQLRKASMAKADPPGILVGAIEQAKKKKPELFTLNIKEARE
jgi:hypothetical protein